MEQTRYEQFLDSARALERKEGASATDEDRCSPRCPGWGVFFVEREPGFEIERCDECARFVDDDEAIDHVLRELKLTKTEAGL